MAVSRKTKFELFVINKIREKRREMRLSQDDIAEILDVTRGFIGQIESPLSPEKYNLNHLNDLAIEFKCSPKDFFPETGFPNNSGSARRKTGKPKA